MATICNPLFHFRLQSQSYRGLSVVSDKVVWVSGSSGTVMQTRNGGKKWFNISPPGYQKKDFRDIHAWNDREAIIMSAGDSAVFLKTKDAGKHWYKVYANNNKGVFFDAIDFEGNTGVAISDPFVQRLPNPNITVYAAPFFVLISKDRGETWEWPRFYVFPKDSTESLFAASGSVIDITDSTGDNPVCWFATGGNAPFFSNLIGGNTPIPLQRGSGCGVYSFHRFHSQYICAVGGCWKFAGKRDSTSAVSTDSGKSWKPSQHMPGGYRSSVSASADGSIWICTGTNGTDISRDFGLNWTPLNIEGFNVCQFSGHHLWLAGDKGRIQKLQQGKLQKLIR